MKDDILYFDLETQRTANDVGGWSHKAKMGMSIGVLFSNLENKYLIYKEDEVQNMIDRILNAKLVVGYNHISFDYEVLMGYTIVDLKSQALSLDMMVKLEEKLGFRPKLDSVASACLGVGKTADGLEALKWWKEGEISKIAEYCCYDVKATKMVYEFGVTNGYIQYFDRNKKLNAVSVDWTL